jgi:3-hydroxyisobutyrate dehydrogenase-like beta-hydroxyacid dehydrogenase
MKKTNISVIGLGSMGLALAKTLLKSDSKISVWNRTLSKSQDLNNKGAHVCLSPIEAFQCSEIIIVCLSNYKAWNNIIDSNQIDMDLSKKTIVQLTSGSIEEVTAHSDWVKKHNGNLLEGAIISFPTEIGTKDSSIILAGNNEVIENCKEIISLLFPIHTNLGDNLIGPTVLSRALVSGGLAGLIGMMNGVAICQKADISLDHFKDIYIGRINPMINQESRRIIEAIVAEDTKSTEASISAWGHGQEALLSISKTLDAKLDFQLALNSLFKQAVKAGVEDHDLSAMVKIFKMNKQSNE